MTNLPTWTGRTLLIQLVTYHLPGLLERKVNFRLAPPGARINNGVLEMNHMYPGLALSYRVNQGEWKSYRVPVLVDGQVEVRASLSVANPDTNIHSRSLNLE